MPEPLSPHPLAKTAADLPGTQSSVNEETRSFRPGERKEDEINLRAFLAPPQAEGELGRLAHYRVLKELGHGGMGMVLLAEDSQLRRMAAIKIMLPHFAQDPPSRERFLREARAAAKIHHDNVVTIFQVSVGEENDLPFIAMEYLKGEPLDRRLKDEGELSIEQAVRIGREIAEGLQAAHAEGLIHRDIKPANIWLEAPKGRVKILDFGLAREERDDAHLTKSGAVVGTPAFMSPEQAHGKPLDARSDLFSLGVVLYRLCTGQQPFSGPNTMAVLTALAVETPAPVRQLNPNVPVELERLIHRLLAKNRGQRPASAEEVAEALAKIEKPANSGMPEVVYVIPTATAVVDDPFADIDATPSSVVPPKTSKDQRAGLRKRPVVESEDQRAGLRKRPESSQSTTGRLRNPARWALLGIGALALLLGAFFALRGFNKNEPKNGGNANDATSKSEPISAPTIVKADPPPLLKAPFTKESADKARTAWAAYLKVPERKQLNLPNGVKLDLVLIPPGQFHMGTVGNTTNEVTHPVTITKPFYMAVTETTQEQYEAVVGKNPSAFSAQGTKKEKVEPNANTSQFPVDSVNWFDAEGFCKEVGARLPTEAQWEYACRAGTASHFHFGTSLNGTEANCDGTKPSGTKERGPNLQRTTKVASYPANAFGLYDMHGNVWEWCRDWYTETMDDLGEKDPERTIKGSEDRRVLRGGSWVYNAINCGAAFRNHVSAPGGRYSDVGFRVVLLLP